MDPITITVISSLGAVAIGLGLYFWGRSAEGTGGPATIVNPNNPTADCEAACKQFDMRRQERCSAKVAEAAAKSELDARRTDYYAALTAALTLLGFAAAALALPWPANLIVGLAFATAATIALAVMLFMLGKLNAASDAWAAASATLTLANSAVLAARNIVISNCPQGVNTPCLSVPDPC